MRIEDDLQPADRDRDRVSADGRPASKGKSFLVLAVLALVIVMVAIFVVQRSGGSEKNDPQLTAPKAQQ